MPPKPRAGRSQLRGIAVGASGSGPRISIHTPAGLARSRLSAETSFSWIYLGESSRAYYGCRKRLAGGVEIPAGPIINGVADEYRGPLLNFDDALEVRDELGWQATDLAERNVFTSTFLHRCCTALTLQRLLGSLEIDLLLVVVDDQVHRRRLEGVAGALGFDVGSPRRSLPVGSGLLRSRLGILSRGVTHRIRFVLNARALRQALDTELVPHLGGASDITLVTWLEPGSFNRDTPDTYLGDLPQALRRRGQAFFYIVNLTLWVHRLGTLLDSLRGAGERVVVPEQILGPWRALAIAIRTLRSPARLGRPFVLNGLDLSDILRDEVRDEWAKPRQLWALQYSLVGAHLVRSGLEPRVVVLPYENQPWEKLLRIGLRAALPDVEVIGFQHTPISTHWFPYFPSERDRRQGQLPDRVFVIGNLWRSLFVEHGYDPDCLTTVPALRFQLRPVVPSSGRERVVLAACSIGFNDSLELAVKTFLAFADAPQFEVRVKLHPKSGVDPETFTLELESLAGIDRERISFAEGSVEEALAGVGLVIYNSTSLAYEALVSGIPALFVESDFWFDLDPIPTGFGSRRTARTPDEILQLATVLLDPSSAARVAHLEEGRRLVEDAFAAGDADDFAALLER